jgi:hypothetical protein
MGGSPDGESDDKTDVVLVDTGVSMVVDVAGGAAGAAAIVVAVDGGADDSSAMRRRAEFALSSTSSSSSEARSSCGVAGVTRPSASTSS